MVGKFSDDTATQIGSKEQTNSQVNDLSYCYPSLSKTITDGDASNDQVDITIITYKKAVELASWDSRAIQNVPITYMNNAVELKQSWLTVLTTVS